MSVLVYNGEKFHRSKLRYFVFSMVFIGVFFLCVFTNNIVGAVLIFFLLGGYFYYSTINNQIVTMKIAKTHLVIGNKNYLRTLFVGYALEIEPTTQHIKNIVFITPKSHLIYSFNDSLDNIYQFIDAIDGFLPRVDYFHQTFFEKLSRKCKL